MFGLFLWLNKIFASRGCLSECCLFRTAPIPKLVLVQTQDAVPSYSMGFLGPVSYTVQMYLAKCLRIDDRLGEGRRIGALTYNAKMLVQ